MRTYYVHVVVCQRCALCGVSRKMHTSLLFSPAIYCACRYAHSALDSVRNVVSTTFCAFAPALRNPAPLGYRPEPFWLGRSPGQAFSLRFPASLKSPGQTIRGLPVRRGDDSLDHRQCPVSPTGPFALLRLTPASLEGGARHPWRARSPGRTSTGPSSFSGSPSDAFSFARLVFTGIYAPSLRHPVRNTG